MSTPPTPKILLYSGGCDGSDALWTYEATSRGIPVIVCSFTQHHPSLTAGTNRALCKIVKVDKLDDGQKKLERQTMVDLVMGLQKKRVTKDYTHKLLERNAAIVQHSDVLFAIGTFTKDLQFVDGGTGTTVSMAILNKVPVYLYETNLKQFYGCRPQKPTTQTTLGSSSLVVLPEDRKKEQVGKWKEVTDFKTHFEKWRKSTGKENIRIGCVGSRLYTSQQEHRDRIIHDWMENVSTGADHTE